MRRPPEQNPARRRAVNLTIRADIMKEAKALNINASQEAEKAIAAAVKKAKEAEWLEQSRGAIEAYNARIEKEGPLLEAFWIKDIGAI